MRTTFLLLSACILTTIGLVSIGWPPVLWSLILVGPLVLMGLYDMLQKKHTIRRNFPVVGNFRYLLESIRPEIMQYFVETDTEGRPYNRIYRSMVYQRAKNVTDTAPFGTQSDTYEVGYEWINHSIYAKGHDELDHHPRVTIGGKDCSQPYSCSVLNVSAMSFGSLSDRAVLALNGGAKKGDFAHNTGEGGVSPYHLKHGGDLIWQIGTGYFGCRAEDGGFSEERFRETVRHPQIKMIEVKLSQGAKPGHGGILPAKKNTKEIAAIRGVEPGTDVLSPPSHKAFSDPKGLLEFIARLRTLSGGRPVGFKLCIGKKSEFLSICQAMKDTGICPDFITIDGGEGGTGAAPVEFSNSVGTPYMDGLAFAHDALVGFGLRGDIKLGASGKIITGFHMARAIALGADFCNSARAMMLALGCIQALQCNTNHCPVGVATQDRGLIAGLNVSDKTERVYNYHHKTVQSFVEMLGAAGLASPPELTRDLINRRVSEREVLTYADIYPPIESGVLLDERCPEAYKPLLADIGVN